MTLHKTLDAALLRCWTIHSGGKYDKEAFKTLQRFVDALPEAIERKIAEAVAAEREACAKVCEEEICTCCWDDQAQSAAEHLADAIRARSKT